MNDTVTCAQCGGVIQPRSCYGSTKPVDAHAACRAKLEKARIELRDAMALAGNRWEEWGERAVLVRDSLDALLKEI
jgi:hypothetical protein